MYLGRCVPRGHSVPWGQMCTKGVVVYLEGHVPRGQLCTEGSSCTMGSDVYQGGCLRRGHVPNCQSCAKVFLFT